MEDIIINVNIDSKKDLYNKYNNKIINSDLGTYLFNELKGKSLSNNVIININTKIFLDSKEKDNIVNIIKNNFNHLDIEDDFLKRTNNIKSIILLIFGTLFIWLSYYLEKIDNNMFKELPLILGWVAIWEVGDYILFSRTSSIIKSKRINQLKNAIINFKETIWKII